MFEYISYTMYFLILLPSFIYISVYIVFHEGSFQFSPEAKIATFMFLLRTLYVHVTPAADNEPESPCFVELQLPNY